MKRPKNTLTFVLSLMIICVLTGCQTGNISKEQFGTKDGTDAYLYTLTNQNGCIVKITNYGGIVTSLIVPDKDGELSDIVLGYDSLDGYLVNKGNPYFGALIGRYGNRIGGAKFELEGKTYNITKNDGDNSLHGGKAGFDKVLWDAKEIRELGAVGLELTYVSKDGEEGYPGTLTSKVKYLWTDKNELKIVYSATTEKTTVVNLTHHSYFNLAGKGNILDHELMIKADKFTPVDSGLIPTGELRDVKGTPFDFTRATKIGARIENDNQQLTYGKGYDHNWALNNYNGKMQKVASLYEATTGRLMEVSTTEPGLQFYSGNFLDGTITGKGGTVYAHRNGLCLETQHFPDSPNKLEFLSTMLKPDEKYSTTTIYKFSTK